MTNIKAPYNFVPVSEKVIFPDWGKAVNHDIPFGDAENGTITVKIKAESPIFVKDSLTNTEKKEYYEDKDVKKKQIKPFDFFQSKDKEYYISGSSIKGMLRSVLEVMTFGKMQKQNVNDDRYSVRDFQNKDIYPMLSLAKEVNAAWLWKEGNDYYLQDCGKPGRIPHHWIDEACGTDFREFYKKENGKFMANNEEHKSAKFKYKMFDKKERVRGFEKAEYGEENKVDVRKFYKINDDAKLKGTLVFTGQSSAREKIKGKIHEFIFFETNNKAIKLDEKTTKNFFFAYFDHDKPRQSVDWKYWKPKLDNGEKIPVFFRYENEQQKTIKDIGLSYLYKIIYKKSVLDAVPAYHKKEKHDFAETLFGYIDDKQSLKGRVHIGHAKVTNKAQKLSAVKTVLSSPKASYYPNYIQQNGKDGITQKYNTFMDTTSTIAGWKRYPIHKEGVNGNDGTDNVSTQFVPLDKGVEFEFKIRVHNLRKIEVGAILSALTFHNTEKTFHSLGMAKPLGYGKVNFKIVDFDGFNGNNKILYLKDFEAYMNYMLKHKNPEWHKSPQITELLTMVSEHENKGKSELAYMKMETKGTNDFVNAKDRKTGGGEYLDKYSNLVEKVVSVTSLITSSDIQICEKEETELIALFKKSDLKILKEKVILNEKEKAVQIIETKKNNLLNELDEAILNIDNLISSVNKITRKASLGNQPNILDIDNNHKKAFDLLKKEIEKFSCAYHGQNNYKKLVRESNDGVLAKEHFELVLNKVNDIFNVLKEKNKEKVVSVYKKKIEEWFGKETAQQWYDELNK